MSSATVTPAMRQYQDAKRQHRDAIVFFRMGDFYEMFYEDALIAARALDLTLTSRSKDAGGNGIPMCGVPFHAADNYLAKLVKKGFRVAVCEQVEDPRKAKGLVRREVVRVVSPGTLTDARYLEAREPAFLMSIVASGATLGVALLDLSTGEFTAAEYLGADGQQALSDEIAVLRPREIVLPPGSTHRRAAAGNRPAAAARDESRWLELRARSGTARARRPAREPRPRRLRARGPRGRGAGGGRPAGSPARDAEGGSRARADHRLQGQRRVPRHRSDHAEAPRDRHRQRRERPRIASRRNRSHDHADGGPPAASVAASPALLARADP